MYNLEFKYLEEIQKELSKDKSKISFWNCAILNTDSMQLDNIFFLKDINTNEVFPTDLNYNALIATDKHLFCHTNWDFSKEPMFKTHTTNKL